MSSVFKMVPIKLIGSKYLMNKYRNPNYNYDIALPIPMYIKGTD